MTICCRGPTSSPPTLRRSNASRRSRTLAGRHTETAFGSLVLCQSFRNPALVAKMAATLHALTGGRFILGMGAGWMESEYRAYGYDFPRAAVRIAQLAEAVQVIRAAWSDGPVSFAGSTMPWTPSCVDRCLSRTRRSCSVGVGSG